MRLKGARGPLQSIGELGNVSEVASKTREMIDAVLDALSKCHSLLLTRHDEKHLSGVHYRGDADGEGHARDSREVVVEEASVGEDRVVGEGLDAGARDERGAGLRRVNRGGI